MNEKVTRMRLGEGLENADAELTRLREMSDQDIDCSDIPELDAQWIKQAKVVTPPGKKQIALRVDTDVLEWMKAQGKDVQ